MTLQSMKLGILRRSTGTTNSARSPLEQLALRCEMRRRQLYRQSERLRLLDETDQEPYRLWLQSREYHLFCRILRAIAGDEATGIRSSASPSPGIAGIDRHVPDDTGAMAVHVADDAEIEASLHRVMNSDLSTSAKDRILSRYQKLRARIPTSAPRQSPHRCL